MSQPKGAKAGMLRGRRAARRHPDGDDLFPLLFRRPAVTPAARLPREVPTPHSGTPGWPTTSYERSGCCRPSSSGSPVTTPTIKPRPGSAGASLNPAEPTTDAIDKQITGEGEEEDDGAAGVLVYLG
ncbi:hypothetical protein AB0B89_15425 [Sphaerisporangium sp. NPDC049002]|uniref:hypothetical protein n=1 Tax=unclassified Sphaerisporangium TaxID=2630420 RepID=UPI0033CDAD66